MPVNAQLLITCGTAFYAIINIDIVKIRWLYISYIYICIFNVLSAVVPLHLKTLIIFGHYACTQCTVANIQSWNNLPEPIVQALALNCFKSGLNDWWLNHPLSLAQLVTFLAKQPEFIIQICLEESEIPD